MAKPRRKWRRLTKKERVFAEEHYELVVCFAQRQHLSLDEWHGVLAEAYVKAVIDFKPEKGIFTTFAYWRMRYAVLDAYKVQKHLPVTVPLDDQLVESESFAQEDDCSALDFERAFQMISLTDRQRRVLADTVRECPQSQMAKRAGTTINTVRLEQSAIREKVREALTG